MSTTSTSEPRCARRLSAAGSAPALSHGASSCRSSKPRLRRGLRASSAIAARFVRARTHLDALGEDLTTTEDHPFRNATDGAWERADALDRGDLVATADGRYISVRGFSARRDIRHAAYNVTVEGVHTYHVGGEAILVHNVCGWSKRGRIRQAGLPANGPIRFVPSRRYNPADELRRGPQGGYLDRFGNEWVRGPSRTAGESIEWDVQLSVAGRRQLGHLSPDGRHLNVSRGGYVTH